MSNSDVPSTTPELKPEPQSVTCDEGCQHRRNFGILRALVYTPVVLLIGGFVALARFPSLAEYAGPLIGESSAKPACQLNVSGMSVGGDHCCSSMSGRAAGMSAADLQLGSCCLAGSSCCSVSENTLIETEESMNSALAVAGTEATSDETPADAISAVNVVETQITQ